MQKIILNDENAVGVLWFIPDGDFVEGKPCRGMIKERYPEGSVYEGQGEYDGKNFFRQGHGVQDFTQSKITGEDIGGPLASRLYKFIGNYDRHLGGWMYGNGIFYLTTQDGKPLAYSKGYFASTKKLSDWHGDFDTDLLLNGFTPDMETELVPFKAKFERAKKRLEKVNQVDYLFLGDSWMEYWTKSELMGGGAPAFDEEVSSLGLNAINIGVGGTEFYQWISRIEEFVKDSNPKKIIISLGGNDLTHGTPVNEIYKNFKSLMQTIHKHLPKTTVYISTVLHSKFTTAFWDKEDELNALMKDFATKNDYVKVLALEGLIFKNGKLIENIDDYFLSDNLHLNRKGYDLWGKAVLREIQK